MERLRRFAPLFDVTVEDLPCGGVILTSLSKAGVSRAEIPASFVAPRLLAEVAERTVRWVYYHASEPAEVSLLSLPDDRVERLSVLYQRWKASGWPT